MNVLVVADGHYYQTKDGTVYADSVYDYDFYKRYLQVFDHVYAVVRVQQVDEPPKGKKVSCGYGVSFLLLPDYHGPYQYIKKYFKIRKVVRSYCKRFDCAIFRIPAATSNIFCRYYSRLKKPFAVEVVVDPWANFGPQAGGNRLVMGIVRHSWTNLVRKMCMKANGASYVTSKYLQKLYPPKCRKFPNEAFEASYSSVELPDESFAEPRTWDAEQKSFIISHAANYFSGYGKGHLVLMDALKVVLSHGYDVSLKFIGDGPKRGEFEEYAEKLGIGTHVHFMGRCANGNEVRDIIRTSDMFILPTYAEGLPRVLLEAMAEGLPCLSSPICGIPEVLDGEYLCEFSDYLGFASKIERFITNHDLMTQQGQRNLIVSKTFASSVLNLRRKEFYNQLKNLALDKTNHKQV